MAPAVPRNVAMILISGAILIASILFYLLVIPSQSHLITQGGREARILMGASVLVVGTFAYPYGLREGSRIAIAVQVAVTLLGTFLLFEGIKGWCLLRAMGVSTPF